MVAKTSKGSLLYVAIVAFFCAIYILPKIKVNFGYVSITELSMFFYLSFIYKKDGLTHIIKILKNLLPYMLLMFVVAKSFDFKMGFLHPFLTAWVMLFPAILCINVIERNSKFEQRSIVLISFAMICYIVFNTIKAFAETPDIMRVLTASIITEEDRFIFNMKNIGGYGIAYGCGAIVVLLTTILRSGIENKILRNIVILLLLYMAYLVFNAQFATLLFLTISCTMLSISYTIENKSKKLLFVFICILIMIVLPLIFSLFIQFYNDTTVGLKLARFSTNVFENGDLKNSSGQRSQNQFNALTLFFHSPIWGHDIVTNSHNAIVYYASHSTVLAVLVATGIIGFISYCRTYWFVVVGLYKKYMGTNKRYVPIIIYFSLFALFNPSESSDASWVIFMIVPLTYYVFDNLKVGKK